LHCHCKYVDAVVILWYKGSMNKNAYIKREIQAAIRRIAEGFPACAVTGPRQSGKSTLLRTMFAKTHNYISFDLIKNREDAKTDPILFLKNAGEKVIFDEIQYVPELLSYIKLAIDKDRHNYGRYYVTGSQQFNLMKNLGDTLAGRIALFTLLPFSSGETAPVMPQSKKTDRDLFIKACLRGAFPEVLLNNSIETETWYSSYTQTYLERDIRSLYNIGDLMAFNRFMTLCAARTGTIMNMSSMSKELGVSVNTVKNWLSVLEASNIIFVLPPYFSNIGKRLVKGFKIYFFDVGYACYLTGIKNEDMLFKGPMAGQLFENFVIMEMFKKYFNSGVRPRAYFLRTADNIEIDLLIESGQKLHLFEIKLSMTPTQKMAGEMEKMIDLLKEKSAAKGAVICLAEKDTYLSAKTDVLTLTSFIKKIDIFNSVKS